MAHDGRHIDDASVALPYHVRNESAAHQKDAGQIRVDHPVPLVERKVDEVLTKVHSGIVDKNVTTAKLRDYLPFDLSDLLLVGDIGEDRNRLGSGLPNRRG